MLDLKIEKFLKYIIMTLLTIIIVRYIPNYTLPLKELIMIGMTTSITFSILDMVSPTVKVNNKNNNLYF